MVTPKKRLVLAFVQTAAAWLGVVLVTFALLRLAADPASSFSTSEFNRTEGGQVRSSIGIGDPLPDQLVNYVRRLVGGDLDQFALPDLGRQPARPVMLPILSATGQFVVAGMVIGLAIALP